MNSEMKKTLAAIETVDTVETIELPFKIVRIEGAIQKLAEPRKQIHKIRILAEEDEVPVLVTEKKTGFMYNQSLVGVEDSQLRRQIVKAKNSYNHRQKARAMLFNLRKQLEEFNKNPKRNGEQNEAEEEKAAAASLMKKAVAGKKPASSKAKPATTATAAEVAKKYKKPASTMQKSAKTQNVEASKTEVVSKATSKKAE